MKNIKHIILGGCALLLLSSQAFAEWDTCSIAKIGVKNADQKIFKVANCGTSANNGKWMRIVNQENAGLATVLTAFAMEKKVNVGGDFPGATTNANPAGNIDTIYLDR